MAQLEFVDTHCHLHRVDYQLPADEVWAQARAKGVTRLLLVGTDADDSERAVKFAKSHAGCWASVGLHPHDAKLGATPITQLRTLLDGKNRAQVVAIGECGLDYYYQHSPKREQTAAFRAQLELASQFDLPLIFHVREAFADFWRVLADFPAVRGVVHSFSATRQELEPVLERGFSVGLNGIMTFSQNVAQLEAAKVVPLDKLMLETDAPFLTPRPHRGTVNEPRYVALVAEFLANLRQESVATIARATTANAKELFALE